MTEQDNIEILRILNLEIKNSFGNKYLTKVRVSVHRDMMDFPVHYGHEFYIRQNSHSRLKEIFWPNPPLMQVSLHYTVPGYKLRVDQENEKLEAKIRGVMEDQGLDSVPLEEISVPLF